MKRRNVEPVADSEAESSSINSNNMRINTISSTLRPRELRPNISAPPLPPPPPPPPPLPLQPPSFTANVADSRRAIPGFVSKLYRMINEPVNQNYIQWSSEGTSFIVHRPEEFSRSLLPRFFKHNNFSSFVRQLNMYGFHKVPQVASASTLSATHDNANYSEETAWEFTNPNFLRGRPDLLMQIKRKISPPGKEEETVLNISHLENVLANPHRLAQEIASLKVQQQALKNDLASIQRDNQLLWNETLASRERHQQQQAVIDKILRFLASIFSSDKAANVLGSAGLSPQKRPMLMIEDNQKRYNRQGTSSAASGGSVLSPEDILLDGSTVPEDILFSNVTGTTRRGTSPSSSPPPITTATASPTLLQNNRIYDALKTADDMQGDLDFLVDNLDPALFRKNPNNDSVLDLDWPPIYPPSTDPTI